MEENRGSSASVAERRPVSRISRIPVARSRLATRPSTALSYLSPLQPWNSSPLTFEEGEQYEEGEYGEVPVYSRPRGGSTSTVSSLGQRTIRSPQEPSSLSPHRRRSPGAPGTSRNFFTNSPASTRSSTPEPQLMSPEPAPSQPRSLRGHRATSSMGGARTARRDDGVDENGRFVPQGGPAYRPPPRSSTGSVPARPDLTRRPAPGQPLYRSQGGPVGLQRRNLSTASSEELLGDDEIRRAQQNPRPTLAEPPQPVASAPRGRQAGMLGQADTLMVTGGDFTSSAGHAIKFSVNIMGNPSGTPTVSASQDDHEIFNTQEISADPNARSSPPSSNASPTRTSSLQSHLPQRTKKKKPTRRTSDKPAIPQRTNTVYERHLILKGRGFPLWIPQASARLPIAYRTKGVRVGDVGIVTPYGAFDFLFNICCAPNDPINPLVLPDGFRPLHPPLMDTDVSEFLEYSSGHYIANQDVSQIFSASHRPGDLVFECAGLDGAVLTMPDGAWHEELGNLTRFRFYVEAHAENWYRFVNGPRGREAKNGDLRLVYGCDKSPSWGMATYYNLREENTSQLRFKPVVSDARLRTGCGHSWEHTAGADVKMGPGDGENDALGATPRYPLRNQCLFIRTINIKLAEEVWESVNKSVIALHHEMSGSESGSMSQGSIFSTSSGQTSSTTTTIPRGQGGGMSDDLPPASDDEVLSCSSQSVIMEESSPAPYLEHPSKAINDFLLKRHPKARMAITTDEDWYSLVEEDDTKFPSDDILLERMQSQYDVCFSPTDGVTFLKLKAPPQSIEIAERKEAASLGSAFQSKETTLLRYLFGQDKEPSEIGELRQFVDAVTEALKAPSSTSHDLPPLVAHPDRLLTLDDLSKAASGNFDYDDMKEQAIVDLQRKIYAPQTQKEDQILYLLRIGNAYLRRFNRLGRTDHLENAFQSFNHAAFLSLSYHYRHLEAVLGLSVTLYHRYHLKRARPDLGKLEGMLRRLMTLDIKRMLAPLTEPPTHSTSVMPPTRLSLAVASIPTITINSAPDSHFSSATSPDAELPPSYDQVLAKKEEEQQLARERLARAEEMKKRRLERARAELLKKSKDDSLNLLQDFQLSKAGSATSVITRTASGRSKPGGNDFVTKKGPHIILSTKKSADGPITATEAGGGRRGSTPEAMRKHEEASASQFTNPDQLVRMQSRSYNVDGRD